MQTDLYLSPLDCPAISPAPSVRFSHHWFPSFGVVKTSEYLAFLMVTVLELDSNCPDLNLNLLDQSKNVE